MPPAVGNATGCWQCHGCWQSLSPLHDLLPLHNKVGLDAKEDFISLALDCWTSKNGYAFLGNIIVSYIFAQLFLNMSFCMLHADCDYCYNWTGRIGLIKIVWGPKVKSFKPSKHGSTSSILPSIYETDEQGIGSKKFSITQRN